MQQAIIHSDGACAGNPGPGGWAAVIELPDRVVEVAGYEPATTNNRMELRAAIEGLRALAEPSEVEVVTDSQYLHNGITAWLPRWKARGWRTATGQPVKNLDLWRALEAETARHRVRWRWIRGHAGHPANERADRLARAEIARARRGARRPENSSTTARRVSAGVGPGGGSGCSTC